MRWIQGEGGLLRTAPLTSIEYMYYTLEREYSSKISSFIKKWKSFDNYSDPQKFFLKGVFQRDGSENNMPAPTPSNGRGKRNCLKTELIDDFQALCSDFKTREKKSKTRIANEIGMVTSTFSRCLDGKNVECWVFVAVCKKFGRDPKECAEHPDRLPPEDEDDVPPNNNGSRS